MIVERGDPQVGSKMAILVSKKSGAVQDDETYRALQAALLLRPTQGAIVQGGGGLRKLRWGADGRGKRGGLRLIYFWEPTSQTFYMLYLYAKNEQGDLTATQLKTLAKLVREEFG